MRCFCPEARPTWIPRSTGLAKIPRTAPADARRDAVDELLLHDAYNLGKPILGICYGLQILNVFRGGTLLQHIESQVNHEAGKNVPVAHTVDLDSRSRLGEMIGPPANGNRVSVAVNSSHHQSAEVVGEGLRIVARCPRMESSRR